MLTERDLQAIEGDDRKAAGWAIRAMIDLIAEVRRLRAENAALRAHPLVVGCTCQSRLPYRASDCPAHETGVMSDPDALTWHGYNR